MVECGCVLSRTLCGCEHGSVAGEAGVGALAATSLGW